MKKILLTGLILLILPFVYSIYAGDIFEYHLDKCDNYTVMIDGVGIRYGEWSNKDCLEYYPGNFSCNCTNDYTINMIPAINSIGDYEMNITYYYQNTVAEISTGGGSGTRHKIIKPVQNATIINKTKPTKTEIIIITAEKNATEKNISFDVNYIYSDLNLEEKDTNKTNETKMVGVPSKKTMQKIIDVISLICLILGFSLLIGYVIKQYLQNHKYR